MPFLMKFSFGPVQDFIAAARKIEDLWSGSQMLGDLMAEVHSAITKKAGVEIVYPAGGPGQEVNLPNTFLIMAQNGEAHDLAAYIKNEARKAFEKLIETRIREGGCLYVEDLADRQINGFLDMCWAAAEPAGNFPLALKNLNSLFDAAKKTRMFSQTAESGIKCALQPTLSALVPPIFCEKQINPDKDARNFWKTLKGREDVPKRFQDAIKADDGERFSAIGLAKRMYRRESNVTPFPSTYSVATALWRLRLLEKTRTDDNLRSELGKLLSEAGEISESLSEIGSSNCPTSTLAKTIPALVPYKDDACGYLLEWEPQLFVETETKPDAMDLEKQLAGKIRKIVRLAEEAKLDTPPKHYALILADGDSMGMIVRSCETKERLQYLSRQLQEFAMAAVETVRDKAVCGREIYAGGDDLMAVVPVESAIRTACEWRRQYREKMRDFGYAECQSETLAHTHTTPATLSVAVMAAPVNYPLNRLLREARHKLENEAKAGEKDALAISVIKGGGEACSVTLPAERESRDSEKNNTFRHFETWAEDISQLVGSKGISSKSMHDLKTVSEQLRASSFEKDGLIGDIITARLATNRELPEAQLVRIRDRVSLFLTHIRQFQAEPRFANPALLADTLLVLRNMGRLSCL